RPQRDRLRLVRLASTLGDPHFLLQHQPLLNHNDLFHDRHDPRVPLLPRRGRHVHHAVHRHALDHYVLGHRRLIDHPLPLGDLLRDPHPTLPPPPPPHRQPLPAPRHDL